MQTKLYITIIVLSILCISALVKEKPDVISLEGKWTVVLDSLKDKSLKDAAAMTLPGTLDDYGLGVPNKLQPALSNRVLSHLTRKHEYVGPATYTREIDIPASMQGKPLELFLERVLWKSTLFVDDSLVGSDNSLVAPHRYRLNKLSPGKHKLTIVVDNSDFYPQINVEGSLYTHPGDKEMAHAYTNHTQIKWNGILGDMYLKALTKPQVEDLQIFPDVANQRLAIHFTAKDGDLKSAKISILDDAGVAVINKTTDQLQKKEGKYAVVIPLENKLALWDEFNPKLYTLRLETGDDQAQTVFGLRQVSHDNGVLQLNGHRIFLRGNLECAIFPLTGHPPMEKEGWDQLIGQAKNYGLNHLRFHSWCPPKAAFEAADEAGFYLQVELPHWSLKFGQDETTVAFLRKEGERILQEYGNHPSFLLFSMGNELQGDIDQLNQLTAYLKGQDSRHLYTTTTFSFQKPTGTIPEEEDEFFVTQYTDKGWIRGQGIFDTQPPAFDTDYQSVSKQVNIPLISHEIGQYSVYPRLKEIKKYTGVLEPLNFKAIKQDLENKGMLALADDFTQASGQLSAMLYKEEIERALKTPGFDGFQLLQLQDFPGQGTALVGLLDAFWDSKGIIKAKAFRQFNSEVVPLLRFEKAVYESGESFKATVEVANFFKKLPGQALTWEVMDGQNKVVKKGVLKKDLLLGNNTDLGEISFPLNTNEAQRYTVHVSLSGTPYTNHWPFWVYPASASQQPDQEQVRTTQSFEEAIKLLKAGETVLLNPKVEELKGVVGRFVPVFWSPVHFPDQPGTMGLLIKDDHPALSQFPTQSHTEWQWWDLCKQSTAVVLPGNDIDPMVRVIDNFVTNRSLATVFEAKVGQGKLLVCTMDITHELDQRTTARQLRKSLMDYMQSDDFKPEYPLDQAQLLALKKP